VAILCSFGIAATGRPFADTATIQRNSGWSAATLRRIKT